MKGLWFWLSWPTHLRAEGASLVITSASFLSHPASVVSWYWQWVIVIFPGSFALMHTLQ